MQFHGADKGRLKYSLLRSLRRLYEPGGQMHYLISAPFILLGAVTSHWYYCDAFRSAHHNCIARPRRKEIEHADAFLPLLLERVLLLLTAICGRVLDIGLRLARDPFVINLSADVNWISGVPRLASFHTSPEDFPQLHVSASRCPKQKCNNSLWTILFSGSFVTGEFSELWGCKINTPGLSFSWRHHGESSYY